MRTDGVTESRIPSQTNGLVTHGMLGSGIVVSDVGYIEPERMTS